MLSIRFQRIGKRNQPYFKIVVTEKRRPSKGGRFVEELGTYNPRAKEITVKKDRIKYWLSVGAKASDTMHNLLVREKVVEAKKIPVHKESKKKETERAAEGTGAASSAGETKGGVMGEKGEEKPKAEKTEEETKEGKTGEKESGEKPEKGEK